MTRHASQKREKSVPAGWPTSRFVTPFTGGTYPGALFNQQPSFGGVGSRLNVWVELRIVDDEKSKREIGLLLQVLKDLWMGELPLGGEASVGRGRLRGKEATLKYGKKTTWKIVKDGEETIKFEEGAADDLEKFVTALKGGAK